MDSKETQAVRAGVITNYNPETLYYKCAVCQIERNGELLAHLNSKEHNNCLVFEAVRLTTPSEALLECLPAVVRRAKADSEVEAVSKSNFSYKCRLCESKKPFTGLVPLEAHFSGKEHEKTKKNMSIQSALNAQHFQPRIDTQPAGQVSQASLYQEPNLDNSRSNVPSRMPLDFQSTGFEARGAQNRLPQYPPSHAVPSMQQEQDEFNRTFQQSSSMNPFLQPGYDLSRQIPSRPDLNQQQGGYTTPSYESYTTPSPQDTKDSPQWSQRQDSNLEQNRFQRQDTYPGSSSHGSNDFSARQPYELPSQNTFSPQAQGFNGASSFLGSNDPVRQTQPPVIQDAYERQEHNRMSQTSLFTSRTELPNPRSPDNSTFSPVGAASLDRSGASNASQMESDYIVTERLSPESIEALNARIVERRENGFYCVICNITVTGPAPLVQHLNSQKHKKKRAAAELPDISTLRVSDTRIIPGAPSYDPPQPNLFDKPQHFQWTVKPSIIPELPNNMVYCNLSKPRGLVVIFNYHIASQNKYRREGAHRDSFTLKTLFSRMGYTVRVHEDYTKQQTKYTLENLQVDPILQQIDSFIMIVLSHGKENLVFYTNDQELMSLDDLRYTFVDHACPNLKGKPKIFLVNFCRGVFREFDQILQPDNIPTDECKHAPKDMITWYASIDSFKALRDKNEGTLFAQALCDVIAEHSHNKELGELYILLGEVMSAKNGSTPEQQNYRFRKFYFNPILTDYY